jgi:hypothetical protein
VAEAVEEGSLAQGEPGSRSDSRHPGRDPLDELPARGKRPGMPSSRRLAWLTLAVVIVAAGLLNLSTGSSVGGVLLPVVAAGLGAVRLRGTS